MIAAKIQTEPRSAPRWPDPVRALRLESDSAQPALCIDQIAVDPRRAGAVRTVDFADFLGKIDASAPRRHASGFGSGDVRVRVRGRWR